MALIDGYHQEIVKETLDRYFDTTLLVRSIQEVKKGNSRASLPYIELKKLGYHYGVWLRRQAFYFIGATLLTRGNIFVCTNSQIPPDPFSSLSIFG